VEAAKALRNDRLLISTPPRLLSRSPPYIPYIGNFQKGKKRHKRQGKERKIVVRTTKWRKIFGYVKGRANSLTCVRRSDYK
jgi:hypothetical protein